MAIFERVTDLARRCLLWVIWIVFSIIFVIGITGGLVFFIRDVFFGGK